jgi:diaminopimelate epimerase
MHMPGGELNVIISDDFDIELQGPVEEVATILLPSQ